jgi:hypothetical protein
MKLINIYYQIKYDLSEQTDLDKVTVKNPDTGRVVKVTSVLNNPNYKDKPVEKIAQQKIASLKKEKKPKVEKPSSSSIPKKTESPKTDDKTKTPSERTSDATRGDKPPKKQRSDTKMSVADIGKEKQRKKVAKEREKVFKDIAVSIFGDDNKVDDIKKLSEEKDDKKRLEYIKKMNPKLKEEHAKIINDMIGPDEKKAKKAYDQLSELFPEEAKDFNSKCEETGITDNNDSALDNVDEPGGTTKPKEESKVKKWGKRIGLGLVLTPAALVGLGIFAVGGLTGSVFGLAGKALDTLTAMVQGTMGTNR